MPKELLRAHLLGLRTLLHRRVLKVVDAGEFGLAAVHVDHDLIAAGIILGVSADVLQPLAVFELRILMLAKLGRLRQGVTYLEVALPLDEPAGAAVPLVFTAE